MNLPNAPHWSRTQWNDSVLQVSPVSPEELLVKFKELFDDAQLYVDNLQQSNADAERFDAFGETMQGAIRLNELGVFEWKVLPVNACWRYNYVFVSGAMFDSISMQLINTLNCKPPLPVMSYSNLKKGASKQWGYLDALAMKRAHDDILKNYPRDGSKLTASQRRLVAEMNKKDEDK